MSFLFGLLFFPLGIALWRSGTGRVGDNPHCAKCHYDLTGLQSNQPGAVRCPECGAEVGPPGTVRWGKRVGSPLIKVLAAPMILIGGLLLFGGLYQAAWVRVLPDSWLATSIRFAPEAAIKEYRYRQSSRGLDPQIQNAIHQQLIDRFLASAKYDNGYYALSDAYHARQLSAAHIQTLLANHVTQIQLRTRDEVEMGHPIKVRIVAPELFLGISYRAELAPNLNPAPDPIIQFGVGPWDANRSVRFDTPGTHTAKAKLSVTDHYTKTSITDVELTTTVEVVDTIEVVAAPRSPEIDNQIVRSAVAWGCWIHHGRNAFFQLNYAGRGDDRLAPCDTVFSTFTRADGTPLPPAPFDPCVTRAGEKIRPGPLTYNPWSEHDGKPVEVLLIANARAAKGTITIDTIWPAALLYTFAGDSECGEQFLQTPKVLEWEEAIEWLGDDFEFDPEHARPKRPPP